MRFCKSTERLDCPRTLRLVPFKYRSRPVITAKFYVFFRQNFDMKMADNPQQENVDMTDRISVKQLRSFSARKKRTSVESWLRSLGWAGVCDRDGWPVVSIAWWTEKTGGTVTRNEEFHVDVEALRRAA